MPLRGQGTKAESAQYSGVENAGAAASPKRVTPHTFGRRADQSTLVSGAVAWGRTLKSEYTFVRLPPAVDLSYEGAARTSSRGVQWTVLQSGAGGGGRVVWRSVGEKVGMGVVARLRHTAPRPWSNGAGQRQPFAARAFQQAPVLRRI